MCSLVQGKLNMKTPEAPALQPAGGASIAINLTTQPPRLHAVQFAALVKHYLAEKRRNVHPETVYGYSFALDFFVKWWQVHGPLRLWYLDEATLSEFGNHLATEARTMQGKPLSYHTQNDVCRRLRTLFRWAHGRGYIEADFGEFVPDAKGAPTPRVPVTLDTLLRLFAACDNTREPVRNRAIVAVLAGTGLRNEECAALRKEAVRLELDNSGSITALVAKNSRPRIVAFDPATGVYLRAWLDKLPYVSGPLFPSRKNRQREAREITPRGLFRLLDTLIKLAGVDEQIVGAHDLRRLFATTWHKSAPEETHLLQKQMGHQRIQTTLGYILRDTSDVADAMRNRTVSPVAHIAQR